MPHPQHNSSITRHVIIIMLNPLFILLTFHLCVVFAYSTQIIRSCKTRHATNHPFLFLLTTCHPVFHFLRQTVRGPFSRFYNTSFWVEMYILSLLSNREVFRHHRKLYIFPCDSCAAPSCGLYPQQRGFRTALTAQKLNDKKSERPFWFSSPRPAGGAAAVTKD